MKWYGLKHGLKTLVMVTFVKRLILLLPGSVLLSDKRLKFASTTENVVIIMKRHENSNWTNLRCVESAKNQFLEKTKMGQFEKGKSVAWIFNMNDLNLPCSSQLLHNKAKLRITPYNPHFTASRGWIQKSFNRHSLSLRRRTSLSQKLPAQLESKLRSFYNQCARVLRIGKYPLSLIGNMDETPMYFDMVPLKSITQRGKKCHYPNDKIGKASHYCSVSHNCGWWHFAAYDHSQRSN